MVTPTLISLAALLKSISTAVRNESSHDQQRQQLKADNVLLNNLVSVSIIARHMVR